MRIKYELRKTDAFSRLNSVEYYLTVWRAIFSHNRRYYCSLTLAWHDRGTSRTWDTKLKSWDYDACLRFWHSYFLPWYAFIMNYFDASQLITIFRKSKTFIYHEQILYELIDVVNIILLCNHRNLTQVTTMNLSLLATSSKQAQPYPVHDFTLLLIW